MTSHRCYFSAVDDLQLVSGLDHVVALELAKRILARLEELLMHCMRLRNLAEVPLAHLIVDGLRRLVFGGGRTPLVLLEVRWRNRLSIRMRRAGKWEVDVMSLVGGEIGIGCGGLDLEGMKHRWMLAGGTWQLVKIVVERMEDAKVSSSCVEVNAECWNLSK